MILYYLISAGERLKRPILGGFPEADTHKWPELALSGRVCVFSFQRIERGSSDPIVSGRGLGSAALAVMYCVCVQDLSFRMEAYILIERPLLPSAGPGLLQFYTLPQAQCQLIRPTDV